MGYQLLHQLRLITPTQTLGGVTYTLIHPSSLLLFSSLENISSLSSIDRHFGCMKTKHAGGGVVLLKSH